MIPGNAHRNKASGFTLIELLITVVLFSLVMSSLMVGLYSGVNSWRRVRDHQDFTAQTERAFSIMGEDLRHMALVTEDQPVLVKEKSAGGESTLEFTALVPATYHAQGRGAVWAKTLYFLEEDDTTGNQQSNTLKRLWTPFVANTSIADAEVEQVLLDSVQSVEFSFLAPNGPVPEWTDPEKLPSDVMITVEFDTGKTMERVFSIPLGDRT